MGYKKVCFGCKTCFNRYYDSGSGLAYPCPNCSKPMAMLLHTFRPLVKTDDKAWDLVMFLWQNGFCFQHIYYEDIDNKSNAKKNVPYPKNMAEAKEFVLNYKNQALK
jgi:hypothetical protein